MSENGQILAAYVTSRDYKKLAKDMKNQSIICMIDYSVSVGGERKTFRDVGRTAYFDRGPNSLFSIYGRGASFLKAFNEDDFLSLCESLNVEFIQPPN